MKKITGVMLLGLSITVAHADDLQQYYDNGRSLISKFRSCSAIPNQTSPEVTRCLDSSSALISKKTSELKSRYAKTINRADLKQLDLMDTANQAAKYKQACTQLYPEPLRQHFKNQIKSCQIQIDLNRYFYVYDHVMNFS